MSNELDTRPNPAAVMANREALIQQLRRWLLSPNKGDGGDDILTLQSRYVAALKEVAMFLEASRENDLSLKFIGLADAIGQLRNGLVADVLKPADAGGRGPDGLMVWSLRAEVEMGLECLYRSRKLNSLDAAAKHIAEKYPIFERLKRDPTRKLAGSILSWRRRINDADVPEAEDVLAHRRQFFEQHGGDDRSPAEMFALGEQLLIEAAQRTATALF